MRKYFTRPEAEDYDDLPAFSEEKMNCVMLIAGICALVATVAAVTAAIVCLVKKNKD